MLQGGVPLVVCLECLCRQDEDENFGVVIGEVTDKVSTGWALSGAVRAYPKLFSPLYLAMLKVGENSGRLGVALDRLAIWIERDEATHQKIKQAVTYPFLVLVASLLMTLSLFYFVVPQFLDVLVGMGAPLPILTKVVLLLSNLVRNPGAWLIAAMIGSWCVFNLRRAWETESGQIRIYRVLLELPLLGEILSSASLARYSTAAEMALSNGSNLMESLELAGHASYNPLIANNAKVLKESLSEGSSLAEHFSRHEALYDRFFIDLVSVGEECAKLDEAFESCGIYYDAQVSYLVDTFSSVLEPILLVGVGSLVGTILIAVFLPMYSVINAL